MGGILGGGGSGSSNKPDYTGLQIQTSANGLSIPIVYGQVRLAPNLIWYGDFAAIKQKSSQGGKGGNASSTSYTYQAAVILALCEGPIVGVPQVWADKTVSTLADLNMSLFAGSATQTPWGYTASKHPEQSLAYPSTAYVAVAPYDLGSSAGLPNHNFETQGTLWSTGAGSGVVDADPSRMILDFLTNPQYGLGFPAANIDMVSLQTGPASYQAYCQATGLWLSAALVDQEAARDTLTRWLQLTNSAAFWSGDTMKIVPYGDKPVTANGYSFTPDVTPIYDLDDDDYVSDGTTDPVQVTRADPADCKNWVKLEILDRSNAYATDPIEAKDQAQIDLEGPLPADQITAHEICDPIVGAISAQLILQRSVYVRNTYAFTLGWEYCLLEPMDIVTLTDAGLGMVKVPVRITSIEEDDQGDLTIEAEEFPAGIATATEYPKQIRTAYTTNYDIPPGPINAPVIFEPSSDLAMGAPQVWVAASGGTNWGGCSVHLSVDGTTYTRIGAITAPARVGVLAASIGAVADPDTSSTLAVNLSESPGATLVSGTKADADASRTLIYVDGELMAYETATLTGASQYGLSYLRRGLFGTDVAAHASGSGFARIDGTQFAYDLPSAYIGQTLYLKFTSFNIYGAAEEDISTVSAYDYMSTGNGGFINPPTSLIVDSANRIAADGTAISTLIAIWTASIGPLLAAYELEYRIHTTGGTNAWQSVTLAAGTTSWTMAPAVEGATYDVQVRAVSGLSPPTYSSFAEPLTVAAVVEDTTVLPAPIGLSASNGVFQQIVVGWALPAAQVSLIGRTEVWAVAGTVTTVDPIAADAGAVSLDAPLPFVHANLPNFTAMTYWIRFVSRSGVDGLWSAPVSGLTSATITLPPGSVTTASLETDLSTPLLNASAAADVLGAAVSQLAMDVSTARSLIRNMGITEDPYSGVIVTNNIQTALNANAASITNEMAVRATNDLAIAATVTALSATVTSNNSTLTSAISSEATTRSSGDSTNATAISALSSTVTANNSTLTSSLASEATTRASGDSTNATAISALSSTVGTANANITTLQSTTASQGTTIASQASTLTSLSSTVGTNTTTIATQATTISGLSAQYTVKIDSNGVVSGFGLASTSVGATPTSSFVVRADQFQIVAPGSGPGAGVPAFDYSGGNLTVLGKISASNIVAGTITGQSINIYGSLSVYDSSSNLLFGVGGFATGIIGTAILALGASTTLAQAYTAGSITIANDGGWHDLQTLSIAYGANYTGAHLAFSVYMIDEGGGDTGGGGGGGGDGGDGD